ncbi:MAG: neutral/alkaline non-lysosomal ceramidase N-terminal domain-containing protein, partial [Planctomycetaceae bacterium]
FGLALATTARAAAEELQADAAEPFQFGFAKADVTPERPLRLSGYGNRVEPFTGIDERLWARAMVLRSDGGDHVLVAVDSIGVPGTFTKDVLERLHKRFGIERERFVICCTHSHTAPHVAAGLMNLFATPLTEEQKQATEEYSARLADQIVNAVAAAVADLKPGRMSVGHGKVGFAANRRVVKDSRWSGFGVNPKAPVDHSVPVLKITDLDGKLRGIVFNYACHCTTLTGAHNRVNGDWAGYAAMNLEEKHPGTVALCTIGCGADANPEPRGELEMAQAHGRALSLEVEAVLKGDMMEITAPPVASFGFAGLPIERPSLDELRGRLDDKSPQARRHAQNMLDLHEKMGRLPETYPA